MGMGCFTTTTTTTAAATATIVASIPSNSRSARHRAVGVPRIEPSTKQQKRRQPSVDEVEKAIGAGAYRDNIPSKASSGKPTFAELVSSSPLAQPEGPAERKLWEVGEWVIDRTESNPRSGQEILLTLCLKILPVWIFLLLIASGLIELPFDVPFLDDLIK